MRYIKAAFLAAAAVVLAGVFACVLAQPARADVSFDVAYSNLSHHGTWLVSSQYGRVWQPSVYNREWSPYYDGHWVYTDMGWTWVSDYEWGAIPYHYGTWVADSESGWVWIPGSVWAPAWVVFRTDSDYIGWAPVPPGYSIGMSVDMGEPSSFVFVSSRDFLTPRVRASIIPRDRTNVFINHTTVVNNIVVRNNVVINRGPDYRIVEKATGHTIREARIESVARVSPFQHTSRAQLAADPARVKQGLRAAEIVPASRPLPTGDRNVAHERKTAPAEASKPRDGRPAARLNDQKSPAPPAAVMPGRAADTARKVRPTPTTPRDAAPVPPAEAKNRADAQQRSNERAAADARKARPAPRPPRVAAPVPPAEAKNRADVQPRTNERAAPDAPKARPAPRPPRVVAARPPAEPRDKAKAEPSPRAQPKARVKPDTKDQTPDKDPPPKPKDGAHD